MQEFKRVLLGRTAIFALVFSLLLSYVDLYVQSNKMMQGNVAYYTEMYTSWLDNNCSKSYEQETQELENRVNIITANIDYFSFYRDKSGGFITGTRDIFKSTYGEDLCKKLENEALPTQEDLKRLRTQQKVCSDILRQINYVEKNYPDYYGRIKENSRLINSTSVFQTVNTFTARNIEKTYNDFSSINETEVTLDNDLAINSMFTGSLAEYILLLYVAVVAFLLVDERRYSIWPLINSTYRGQLTLAFRRIVILLCASLMGTIVILGGRFLIASLCFGGIGNPARNIQSMEIFMYVPQRQSVLEFLCRYAAVKILGTWLISLILWSLLSSFSAVQLSIAVSSLFTGIEYIAFTLIPDNNFLCILRYINIFAFVDYKRVFLHYLNLNIFGYPVTGSTLCIFLLPFLIAAASAGCIGLSTSKSKFTQSRKSREFTEELHLYRESILYRLSFGFSELIKLVRLQKAVPIILMLVIWACFIAEAPDNYCSTDHTEAYCRAQIEGVVSVKMLEDINAEISRLEGSPIQNEQLLKQRETFKELYDTAQALIREESQESRKYWIIDSTLYDSLLNSRNKLSGFIALLFTVLLTCGIFAVENKNRTALLIKTTLNGKRNILWVKLATAYAITFLVFVVVYGRELSLAAGRYGELHSLSASVSSLCDLYQPSPLPIGWWLVLSYAKRLLLLLAADTLVLLVSLLSRSHDMSALLCTVILILPSAIHLMDDRLFSSISFVHLLSMCGSNMRSVYVVGSMVVCFIGVVLIGAIWDDRLTIDFGRSMKCNMRSIVAQSTEMFTLLGRKT